MICVVAHKKRQEKEKLLIQQKSKIIQACSLEQANIPKSHFSSVPETNQHSTLISYSISLRTFPLPLFFIPSFFNRANGRQQCLLYSGDPVPRSHSRSRDRDHIRNTLPLSQQQDWKTKEI